jgi:hypothetical protein
MMMMMMMMTMIISLLTSVITAKSLNLQEYESTDRSIDK